MQVMSVLCPVPGGVLLLLKPGFTRHAPQILADLADMAGDDQINIASPPPFRLTREDVQAIWGHAEAKMGPRYSEMVAYLMSGPVRAIFASSSSPDFAKMVRTRVGTTDPRMAGINTWRWRWSTLDVDSPTYYRNVLHAATDADEASQNLSALAHHLGYTGTIGGVVLCQPGKF